MSVSGSFKELTRLVRQVRAIGKPEFALFLTKRIGARALKLIADEFRGEVDPYGKPWEKLKHRKGRILRDTGRLAASFSARPAADGLRVGTPVEYAAPHQYGAQIKEHHREGGVLAFSKKGRFLSRRKADKTKAKSVRVAFFGERTQAGYKVPRRQMVPEAKTGGVGAVWGEAFNEEADKAMRAWLGVKD